MDRRPLGLTGIETSVLGYGAFKIGRNQGIKYEHGYDLPSEDEAGRLLHAVLDLGIDLIDVAPAYGSAEERVGRHLEHRRDAFTLCTKVGETFEDGVSTYDFTPGAVRRSVRESLRRLRTDVIDVLLVHSDRADAERATDDDLVATLEDLRDAGLVRAIGFSGRTVASARLAMRWAQVLMIEYHPLDASHADVMSEARDAGLGVLVKKGLASGRVPAGEAIPFVLGHAATSSLVVGGLSLEHLQENVRLADSSLRA